MIYAQEATKITGLFADKARRLRYIFRVLETPFFGHRKSPPVPFANLILDRIGNAQVELYVKRNQ
jgi:hypothetical protein